MDVVSRSYPTLERAFNAPRAIGLAVSLPLLALYTAIPTYPFVRPVFDAFLWIYTVALFLLAIVWIYDRFESNRLQYRYKIHRYDSQVWELTSWAQDPNAYRPVIHEYSRYEIRWRSLLDPATLLSWGSIVGSLKKQAESHWRYDRELAEFVEVLAWKKENSKNCRDFQKQENEKINVPSWWQERWVDMLNILVSTANYRGLTLYYMASYGETIEESDDRKMLVDSICKEYIRLKGDKEFLRDIFQLQEWTRHVIPDNFDEELLLLCYSLEGATGIWEKIGEMEYQRSSEYKLAMMSPWTAKLWMYLDDIYRNVS